MSGRQKTTPRKVLRASTGADRPTDSDEEEWEEYVRACAPAYSSGYSSSRRSGSLPSGQRLLAREGDQGPAREGGVGETQNPENETDSDEDEENRSDQTKRRSDQTKSRSDQTKNRSDQTKSRSDQTKSRSDQTKSRSDQTKSRSDQTSEKRSDQTKSRSDQTKSRSDQTKSRSDQTKSRSDQTNNQNVEEMEEDNSEAESGELIEDSDENMEEDPPYSEITAEESEEMRITDEQVDSISPFKQPNYGAIHREACREAKRPTSRSHSSSRASRRQSPSPQRSERGAHSRSSTASEHGARGPPPMQIPRTPSTGKKTKDLHTGEKPSTTTRNEPGPSTASDEAPPESRMPPISRAHPRPCRGCGKKFTVGWALRRHFSFCQLHQLHLCPVYKCDYWYKRAADLTQHMKHVHATLPEPNKDEKKRLVEAGRRTIRLRGSGQRATVHLTRPRAGLISHRQWNQATFQALHAHKPPLAKDIMADHVIKGNSCDKYIQGRALLFTMWPPEAEGVDDGKEHDPFDSEEEEEEAATAIRRREKLEQHKRQHSADAMSFEEEEDQPEEAKHPAKRGRRLQSQGSEACASSTRTPEELEDPTTFLPRDLELAFAARWRRERGLPVEKDQNTAYDRLMKAKGGPRFIQSMQDSNYFQQQPEADPATATTPARRPPKQDPSPGRAIPRWLDAPTETARMSAFTNRYIRQEWMTQREEDRLRRLLAHGDTDSVHEAAIELQAIYRDHQRVLPLTWLRLARRGCNLPIISIEKQLAAEEKIAALQEEAGVEASDDDSETGGVGHPGASSASQTSKGRQTRWDSSRRERERAPRRDPDVEFGPDFGTTNTGEMPMGDWRWKAFQEKQAAAALAAGAKPKRAQTITTLQAEKVSVSSVGQKDKRKKQPPAVAVTVAGVPVKAIAPSRGIESIVTIESGSETESCEAMGEDEQSPLPAPSTALPARAGRDQQLPLPHFPPQGPMPTLHRTAYPSTTPMPDYSQNFFGVPTLLAATGASFSDGTGLELPPNSFVQVIRPSAINPCTGEVGLPTALVVAIRRPSVLHGEIVALPPLPIQRAAHLLCTEMAQGALGPTACAVGRGSPVAQQRANTGVSPARGPPLPSRVLFPQGPGPGPIFIGPVPPPPPRAPLVMRFVQPNIPPAPEVHRGEAMEPTQEVGPLSPARLELLGSLEVGGNLLTGTDPQWAMLHLSQPSSPTEQEFPHMDQADLQGLMDMSINTPETVLIVSPSRGSPRVTAMVAPTEMDQGAALAAPSTTEAPKDQQDMALATPSTQSGAALAASADRETCTANTSSGVIHSGTPASVTIAMPAKMQPLHPLPHTSPRSPRGSTPGSMAQ